MTHIEPTDPYVELLHLPPGRRPPNHYELLGLELFCSSPERIQQAVRKQFRLVKPYQDHPVRVTREGIQDIMNAIATARVVLTDPDRKESYDRVLAVELNIDRDAHLAGRLAAPLPEFALRVVAGPSLVDERIELLEGTTYEIGASTRCALTVDPGRAAELHARVHHVDGVWCVERLAEEHGLWFNGTECTAADLNVGDIVDFGGYRFAYEAIERTSTMPNAPSRKKRRVHPPRSPAPSGQASGGPSPRGPAGRVHASRGQAPPLSLMIRSGPSIPSHTMNVLPPQRIVIGSGEAALWQLPDRRVSRLHAAVQSVGDRWEVEDLGGVNPTQVNGAEILRHILNDRDVLTIGPFEILASLRY
ncbi:MAG: FHA domain-containing protein [Phycisphaerales bacterium]|nr:FHA domain-containing protein [Phycisphaerales bacterium]